VSVGGECGLPGRGPGSAAFAVATLRLTPLRQAPSPAQFAATLRGRLIVAHGEG
jgi:hypothetical protein